MTAPKPFLPPDVDLTDFQFMPLDARRLRDSRIAASVSGEAFRSAVLLWCAAWHQVPAASLPDDDIQLAQLAGFGRVVSAWSEVREGALHGWIKCSDRRLYHPVVAEKAIEAWNSKLLHKWKRECDRIRKENKSRENTQQPLLDLPSRPIEVRADDDGIPPSAYAVSDGNMDLSDGKPEASSGIPAENALKGQGQGQGKEENICPKPDKPVRTRVRYSDDFEQFWSAYPTDKLMSKQEAWKVWDKLTEEDRASAIAAIPGFVAHCRKNPTYRAVHAVRFLAQRRFDGFAPQQKPTGAPPRGSETLLEFAGGIKRSEGFVRRAVADWRQDPKTWPWDDLGEPPDSSGCRVPKDLLKPELEDVA